MHSKLSCIFLGLVLTLVITPMAMAIPIVIDTNSKSGSHYLNSPVEAVTVDNTIMVPISPIIREMGYRMSWNPADKSLHIYDVPNIWLGHKEEVVFRVGDKSIMVNNQMVEMSVAPRLIDGYLYVASWEITEMFNYNLNYASIDVDPTLFITDFAMVSDKDVDRVDDSSIYTTEYEEGGVLHRLIPGCYMCCGLCVGSNVVDAINYLGKPAYWDNELNVCTLDSYTGTLTYFSGFTPNSEGRQWHIDCINGKIVNIYTMY